MKRRYYTLAVYFTGMGKWSPEFGDYDRATVLQELADYRDAGHKAKHLRIISTPDTQADIDAAVAKLNGDSK